MSVSALYTEFAYFRTRFRGSVSRRDHVLIIGAMRWVCAMSACSLVLLSSISRRSLRRFLSEELNLIRSPISFEVQEVFDWLLAINACRLLRSVYGENALERNEKKWNWD